MTDPAASDLIESIDFYWRRGCGFCMMLDRSLAKAGIPMTKHDIWADPDAAAVVRDWARGTETVPTVVVGDVGLVNPTSDQVIRVLAEKAPHLVPEDWEPDQPNAIGSLVKRLFGG
jgi:mycoredoxin